jgi:hypothetical protein
MTIHRLRGTFDLGLISKMEFHHFDLYIIDGLYLVYNGFYFGLVKSEFNSEEVDFMA